MIELSPEKQFRLAQIQQQISSVRDPETLQALYLDLFSHLLVYETVVRQVIKSDLPSPIFPDFPS